MRAWWRRPERPAPRAEAAPEDWSPLLPGLKRRLDALLDEEDPEDALFTDAEERAREAAARHFRAAPPDVLADVTRHLWQYYRDTVAELTPEQCQEQGVPLLPPGTDVWTQVSFTTPPRTTVGDAPLEPAPAYVSFEGEVTWEPEHGLQLVLEDGVRVGKVGPYDGHVTHAHAYGDPALLETVYRR